MRRKKQNCIKRITFYVDASELYSNPDDLDYECAAKIINDLKEFSILDYDVCSISKDEADTFELE